MMAASKVRRSTIAVQSRGSVNVFVHPPQLSLEALATLFFSPRSVRTWNSNSAPLRSSSVYPNSSMQRRSTRRIGRLPWPAAARRPPRRARSPAWWRGCSSARVADQADRLPLLTHSQVARVLIVAASTLGFASKSNARSDFSHGKAAALMHRSWNWRHTTPMACTISQEQTPSAATNSAPSSPDATASTPPDCPRACAPTAHFPAPPTSASTAERPSGNR